AASEVGALAYWYINYQDAEAVVKSTDSYTDERIAEEKTITNNSELLTHQAETDQYVEDSNKYVKATRKKAEMGLIAAGALWGIGVIEAFVNQPDYKVSKKKKKKKGPFAHLNLDLDDDLEFKNLYNGHVLAVEKSLVTYDYQILPINYLDHSQDPGILLRFQVKY
ncbi:hypothetical protein MEO40_07035, partial [Dolichospermum sp. ST_sed1]|nr:hypothetical protein [Dolichospermum sp. ST_sed1]